LESCGEKIIFLLVKSEKGSNNKNMNLPPQTFITICGIADISEEKTRNKWLQIWEKTIKEFLEQVIKEVDFSKQELNKLKEVFENIIDHKIKNKNIFESILAAIGEEKQRKIIQKLAGLFVDNLTNFYSNLRGKLKYEQRQALDSYLKVSL